MPLRPAPVLRGTARASVTLAAIAALAACADTVTAPAAGTAAPALSKASYNPEFNSSDRRLHHTREYYATHNGAGSTTGSTTGISYHGGTVLQAGTKVVAIYWGSGTYPVGYQNLPTGAGAGSADGSLLGVFLRSLGSLVDAAAGKKYFNINATYYGSTGANITPTVSYTGYWNTATTAGAPVPSASPTDADMIALVNWGLANGKLAYDASTVYAIFTGTGVNLGGGFGTQYCAYHTHGSTPGGQTFFYAAMPYNQQYPSSCTSGGQSPNADVAANSEVNTLAHEIEETTTDDMGNAWFDSQGYENADKCAWTWGTYKRTASGGYYNQSYNGYYFLVQQNWVNAGSGGCATAY